MQPKNGIFDNPIGAGISCAYQKSVSSCRRRVRIVGDRSLVGEQSVIGGIVSLFTREMGLLKAKSPQSARNNSVQL
jgi:hypothetical protein